jgi:chromosome segregation ATPase
MAKKIKPKSLLDTNVSNINIDTANNDINNTNINNVSNNDVLLTSVLNKDQQDKLEKYDAMEKTVSDLIAEKENLQAKLEEYMLANSTSTDNSSLIRTLQEENEKLTNELNSLKSKANTNANMIIKLQDENKSLRDENDQYLMKISELTFDNANLTCQLDELSKSVRSKDSAVVNQTAFKPTPGPRVDNSKLGQPFRNPYNPYENNGYGSW